MILSASWGVVFHFKYGAWTVHKLQPEATNLIFLYPVYSLCVAMCGNKLTCNTV